MSKKGHKKTKEHKEKIRQTLLGHDVSEETRNKMKGDKNPAKRPEVREKMRQSALNRPPMTEEHRQKIGLARKGQKHTEEAKKKISKALKGEKCYNWQGGKSLELYSFDWTDDLRDSIRKRDNYICQECGIHQDELIGLHKKLDVHHKDYNKKNLNPKNLISLCRSCHTKTNFNREYWIKHW